MSFRRFCFIVERWDGIRYVRESKPIIGIQKIYDDEEEREYGYFNENFK